MTARWGFRGRLTVLIAGVFVAGGAALLGVQYLVVQHLFAAQTRNMVAECQNVETGDPCSFSADQATVTIENLDPLETLVSQADALSSGVLSGLLMWSIIVLLVFAALAVLAASWLSQRSLRRIGMIAETTKRITREDLHRRLRLDGPDDEIRDLGDTIDGMLDRLEESFTRQDRFIASASHELRTPLTTTRTALEIPLAQGLVPAELQPDVRRALDANERSERLITALLALARGGAAEATESVDLVRLAYDAASAHPDAEIRIGGAATALARGEDELLGVAVGNLIANAVRHGSGDISVECATADGRTTLTVENAGAEYSEQDAARLVEPFNRGSQTRVAGGGTGLGLTLVDTIAQTFGGSLSVRPRVGGGLIVRLELPFPESA